MANTKVVWHTIGSKRFLKFVFDGHFSIEVTPNILWNALYKNPLTSAINLGILKSDNLTPNSFAIVSDISLKV